MTTRTFRHGLILGTCAFLLSLPLFEGSAFAQARRYGTNGITVFTNPNFGGQSATFREDTPDLRGYNLNDKISSLEIPNGEAWEVCQDINFGNRCQVFTGNVPDLRQMGWSDRISSLRRVNGGFGNRGYGNYGNGPYTNAPYNNRNNQLVFYDRPNFRGNTTMVTNQSANLGGRTNNGSVEVRGGAWQLCDTAGRCATVTRSVSNLNQLGLGRIASARQVNDNDRFNDRRYDPRADRRY